MKKIILGSQSPRRREILSYFDLPFEQISSDFDEDSISFEDNPADYVTQLALSKAQCLSEKYDDQIILTADTTVYYNHKIYNKPTSAQEAFQSLSELSGQWHSVYTGVCISYQKQLFVDVEETQVLFNSLTPTEIKHYHDRIHWIDKAAGYAIQMAGGLIVNKINGCYYNVLGLPINTVRKLLKNVGIELWNHVK